MMPYLFDSDWVLAHMRREPEALRLFNQLVEDGIAISIITYMELFQIITSCPEPPQAQDQLQAFLDCIPVLPFSMAVAQRCGRLRDELARQNRPVNARALSLMIAAIALEYDLTLVARDTKDYEDIADLRLYRP